MGANSIDAIAAVGLALALGLLVGIERGWTLRNEQPGSRFAGVRTFGLLGLAGGVSGVISATDRMTAAVLMAAATSLILLGYVQVARREGNVSGTASLVGVMTLACGYLATTHEPMIATVIAVATTLVLALRTQLHGWIKRLSQTEIGAITRFALISMAILPLLPDRNYGPLNAWNPHQLWMVVVMVSGFSFVGYIATRWLGASRGIIAAAGAGAIVSSTAVTADLANQMRSGNAPAPILAAGIAAASTVMFLRVLVLVAVLAPFALATLAIVAAPAAIVSAGGTLYFLYRAARAPSPARLPITVRNPFDIMPALALMALVMVVSLISRWMLQSFGDAGLATVLALSGMLDVDSAIITMSNLPPSTLDARTAGLILAAPVMLNTLFKAMTAISLAGWSRGWPAGAVLVASLCAGMATLPIALT